MYLKKVLNQPNLVGTVMIALMVCSGFVYAFAFDGFNVETATGGEVEEWLEHASGGASGGGFKCTCGRARCPIQTCSGCGQYNCKSFCGQCSCNICTSATGKACQRLNNVCRINP
jgi:hypothetical protein